MAVSRFQAEQGDVVRLRVRFERGNNLFDPFSITKVEVRRDTGPTTSDLVATYLTASVVQEAQGIFYVDHAIPADELVGAYIDRWYYVENSGDAEASDDARFAVLPEGSVTPAVGGYITVAEVREEYLPGTLRTDQSIEVLIAQATEIINKYPGQAFGPQALTYEVDGTGRPFLILPDVIISIDSIIATSCGVDTTEFDPADFAIKGRWLVSKGYVAWPMGQCHDFNPCVCGPGGQVFPLGQKNISVSGTFGMYEEVPVLITRAAGLLVMHGGQDDNRTSPMAENYSSESVEQHSWTLRELSQNVSIKGSTGIAEVDHILNMHRRIRGRMAVI